MSDLQQLIQSYINSRPSFWPLAKESGCPEVKKEVFYKFITDLVLKTTNSLFLCLQTSHLLFNKTLFNNSGRVCDKHSTVITGELRRFRDEDVELINSRVSRQNVTTFENMESILNTQVDKCVKN
ncbi:uncharacterized protein TA12170 [Theileria annulata]|uniref:Uncharacterized protein n=1 Tax=Theileria annulata TaxID=5874 RepID=Q4UDW0_THEAN|nr:uncharacterized protein TA12170 [Theileria annulata]CAI74729.1 hypothetical protein TA12170 [Theileria annulata]|eukprot:XP_952461.1 hypothetical protein TA12170 [Theileria annulata]